MCFGFFSWVCHLSDSDEPIQPCVLKEMDPRRPFILLLVKATRLSGKRIAATPMRSDHFTRAGEGTKVWRLMFSLELPLLWLYSSGKCSQSSSYLSFRDPSQIFLSKRAMTNRNPGHVSTFTTNSVVSEVPTGHSSRGR